RLDLSREQKGKVIEAVEGFVRKNEKALDGLRRDQEKVQAALEKAKKDRDREAFKEAQEQRAALEKRSQKLRDELEPAILAVLTARMAGSSSSRSFCDRFSSAALCSWASLNASRSRSFFAFSSAACTFSWSRRSPSRAFSFFRTKPSTASMTLPFCSRLRSS